MLGLAHIPYELDEKKGWAMNIEGIESSVRQAQLHGVTPRVLVIINPSNPTGALLNKADIASLIEIAAEHDLLVLADEVYQSNIFPGEEFVSVKKILRELQDSDQKYAKVQLISLHSVSKGITGEGGQRGGYFETWNLPQSVHVQLQKLVNFMLQPATPGQIVLDCMVQPPKQGEPSYELYSQEKALIEARLEDISTRLYSAFGELPGVSCQKPKGALYLFPRIDIPPSAVKACQEDGMSSDEVDVWFCMQLLKGCGVCVVPGSGFGKPPRSLGDDGASVWFRITFLAEGEEWIEGIREFLTSFYSTYSSK